MRRSWGRFFKDADAFDARIYSNARSCVASQLSVMSFRGTPRNLGSRRVRDPSEYLGMTFVRRYIDMRAALASRSCNSSQDSTYFRPLTVLRRTIDVNHSR